MKKIKLFTALAVIAPIAAAFTAVTSCGEKASVDVDSSVTSQDVKVTSFNIVKGKRSTIVLEIPDTKVLAGAVVVIDGNTLSVGDGLTIRGTTITIAADKVTSIKVTLKSVTLNDKSVETLSAEEYIRDRTFGIAGLNSSSQWLVCGTGWIISDPTTSTDDYTYWIATNWHVKYGIDAESQVQSIGFHFDGMGDDVYQKFEGSIAWEDASNFEFNGSTASAIDFYVAKVTFASSSSSLPTIAKTRLDKVNAYKKEHGYVNKFVESSSTDNFTKSELYCGGYPAKKRSTSSGTTLTQKLNFENIPANSDIEWKDKDTKYLETKAGHPIDSDDESKAQIFDVSANYYYNAMFECTYDELMGEWIPDDWSLSGGASGSMLITKQSDEWVVVGIYWGGWTLANYPVTDVWFCPAWSMFKTADKDFVSKYA